MSPNVALFVTCIVDQLFPNVGMAMVSVLERAGCKVTFPPDQTCCGQPAFNSGYRDQARTVARHFLNVFRDAEFVVIPSGSCTSMVSHHFHDLFPDSDEVHRLAAKTFEFSQFLTEVLIIDQVGARLDAVATYHDGCHALRELHIKAGPRRLLSAVSGLELREMDTTEECCGFGGTFSIKFPEISGGMARTKIDSILRTGAEVVISTDSSCLMQLQGAIRKGNHPLRTMHLAEVLACQ
ncbi:MAG: (Fe-S)-binding protein [Bryobacteraceae bacterium]|nr:(Fe-S)-binding protein [Bryobacteraceae bacterium]